MTLVGTGARCRPWWAECWGGAGEEEAASTGKALGDWERGKGRG